MTTMHPDGGRGQDVQASPLLSSTPEDFLAQIEHESVCLRREARALRRRLRRRLRRERWHEVRVRVVRFAVKTGAAGLAVAGTAVFVAAVVVLVLGHMPEAMELFGIATAAWAGVAAAQCFRVCPRDEVHSRSRREPTDPQSGPAASP
ncbi:hypothetical protein R3L02_41965 [Streptomyces scabiei]|uniref:hypothetical protein n=1 Tax=Streptomyces scabiei TaxID=1930 RepID=UPI00298F0472|nr:hypothetical protein [Streptomyces scabiei]MDW8478318.1 hypothetical protein [Streptomyces scabiei]